MQIYDQFHCTNQICMSIIVRIAGMFMVTGFILLFFRELDTLLRLKHCFKYYLNRKLWRNSYCPHCIVLGQAVSFAINCNQFNNKVLFNWKFGTYVASAQNLDSGGKNYLPSSLLLFIIGLQFIFQIQLIIREIEMKTSSCTSTGVKSLNMFNIKY